jgi:hypothetical protein
MLKPFTPQSAFNREDAQLVVALGQQQTSLIDLGGYTVCGLFTPAALSSSSIRFLVSHDGQTAYPLYDSANLRLSLSVATNVARAYALDPRYFLGWRFFGLDLASAEAAERTITLLVKPL